MFTLQFTRVNNSPGQRITILQVVLTVFKRNNRLWLYVVSQLILRIENYQTTRRVFSAWHPSANSLWNVYCLKHSVSSRKKTEWRSPVLLHTSRSIKRENTLSLTHELFIKVSIKASLSAPLTFSSFSSRKRSVCRHVSASRLEEMSIVCGTPIRSLVEKKLYLRLCLTQIVHSDGTITLALIKKLLIKGSIAPAPLTFSKQQGVQ